jgi:hypothetical protein
MRQTGERKKCEGAKIEEQPENDETFMQANSWGIKKGSLESILVVPGL